MKETGNTTQIAEFNNAWKGRGNLANLVEELKRQRESRHDFVSDVRNFKIEVREGKVLLAPKNERAGEWLPDGAICFNPSAVRQLADKCEPNIPAKFFDRMLEQRPNRLEELLNALHDDGPAKRLVRTLDGNVRAWLSDSYRVIDNLDMAFTCMDAAQRVGGQVIEANLSDTNMRIKFTSQAVWDKLDVTQRSGPQGGWFAGAIGNRDLIGKSILGATIREELPGGPSTVHPVVTITNSETGHGGFRVRLGILMGICFNVATLEDVVAQVHLGERLAEGVYSQETIATESKAISLKARDGVLAAFDQTKFQAMIKKVRKSTTMEIENATSAVENVIEANEISEEKKDALLEYFLRDYNKTQFGLAQAVSRLAQDTDDTDEADKLENLAGKLMLSVA
jgi:hypothetical protein